jgi:hypothetical protein
MLINIYTANHGKLHGIEDYLTFLDTAFKARAHSVKISEELDPAAINIIIDEFTNQIRNREIIEFRKLHPDAKLYLLLTEFFESRFLINSLNFFGGLFDAAIIAALDVYARLIRKEFQEPTPKHWGIALLYSPILLLYALLYRLRHPGDRGIKRFIQNRVRPCAYLHLRYLGLEKMINVANGLILAHGMIAPGAAKLAPNIPILGTVYPEIDEEKIKERLFSDKKLFIEITGSITPYRQHCIERLNTRIILLGISNIFEMCTAISFCSNEKSKLSRGAYALHPPQTKRWKYCSPTRIYRSLQVDNCMPVLTKHFGQHPIEDLCLVFRNDGDFIYSMYRYYKSPELLLSELGPKLSHYMRMARENNDALIRSILTCSR